MTALPQQPEKPVESIGDGLSLTFGDGQTKLLHIVFAEGRVFRLYSNGMVSGFKGEVAIINHLPRLFDGIQRGELDFSCLAMGTELPHLNPQSLAQTELPTD